MNEAHKIIFSHNVLLITNNTHQQTIINNHLTMMRLFSNLLPALLLLLGPIITPAAAVQGILRRRGSSLGFYESRPDGRKCKSPYCGGYFVRPIDGSSITCPGASEATLECYVAALRNSIDVPPPPVSSDVSVIVLVRTFFLTADARQLTFHFFPLELRDFDCLRRNRARKLPVGTGYL
jgi:hypothetical protein